MNHSIRLLSILALSFSIQLANAHDPKEHAKEAAAAKAAPDCAAMKDMDHSKMDPNDPVRQAMMARCGMEHSQKPVGETKKPDAPQLDHQGGH